MTITMTFLQWLYFVLLMVGLGAAIMNWKHYNYVGYRNRWFPWLALWLMAFAFFAYWKFEQ